MVSGALPCNALRGLATTPHGVVANRGATDNQINSCNMTIATVDLVILGPVMLVPHEAGSTAVSPPSM